jgi:hypothetical protein
MSTKVNVERWITNVKIAYEKKLPDQTAWYQLLDGTSSSADEYTRFMQYGQEVVSAYDGDKLVGVGVCGGKAADAEVGEKWAVVIHPSYAQRDIEHNMKKLVCW